MSAFTDRCVLSGLTKPKKETINLVVINRAPSFIQLSKAVQDCFVLLYHALSFVKRNACLLVNQSDSDFVR